MVFKAQQLSSHTQLFMQAQNFGWIFDVAVAAGRTWGVSIDEVLQDLLIFPDL